MSPNMNPNQVISVPYGSIQLATEEQRNVFRGLVASHNGLHSTGDDLEVRGGDDGGEEIYGESDDDEEGPSPSWRKDSNATTGSSNQDSGLGSPKGKGKAFDAATTESKAQAKKAFVKGQQDSKTGRRKINISFIEDDARRHITFSKRKAGIMKKAYELATLTGTQVLLLVVSSTGLVYTFSTPKLKPVVRDREGRELIQACLNAPDSLGGEMDSDRTSTAGSTSGQQQARHASHKEALASARTPTLDSRPMSPGKFGPGSPPRGAKRRRTASMLDNQEADDVAGGRLIARQRQQQQALQHQQQQGALQQLHQARSHTIANFSQTGKVVAGSHRMVHNDSDHSGNNHSGASDSSSGASGHNNSLGLQMSAEDAELLHTHAFMNSLPHTNFAPNGPQPTAAPWLGALAGPQLLFEAPPEAKAQQVGFWNGNDVTNLVDTNDQVTQVWGRS